MTIQQMLLGAGGAKDTLGIDQLFRLDGYTGGGSTALRVAQGLDMTEGGMGTCRPMTVGEDKFAFTTSMGVNKRFELNGGGTEYTGYTNSFETNGFFLRGDGSDRYASASHRYVQTTWRNADNWFKEFSYTGDGNSTKTITHGLGSTPGMIWISTSDMTVWHNSNDTFSSSGDTWDYYLRMGGSQSSGRASNERIKDVGATTFTIGNADNINTNGTTYRVMCFAHNQAKFGPDGDKVISKCGVYYGNTNASSGTTVTLGWRPQFVLIKRRDSTGDWTAFDIVSGVTEDTDGNHRDRETSLVKRGEGTSGDSYIHFSPTGFQLQSTSSKVNASGAYIYYAVRADDGASSKVPENGNEVFDSVASTSSSPRINTNMRPDFVICKANKANTENWRILARAMGGHEVRQSNFEGDGRGSDIRWDRAHKGGSNNGIWESTINNSGIGYAWKSSSCFDYVQYQGLANGVRNISHNLGGVPEIMIGRRWHTNGGNSGWNIYYGNPNRYYDGFEQNYGTATNRWNDTSPTATQFTIGTSQDLNANGKWHWVGLWRSVDGICNIGTYTGNGTDDRAVNLGFQPRWLLLKRIDGSSDWCIFDLVTNGTFGSFIRLNNTGAPIVQNTITRTSTGFTADNTSASGNNFNGDGETWLYWAHA